MGHRTPRRCLGTLLILAGSAPALAGEPAAPAEKAAWVLRGEEVEARYQVFGERLEKAYAELKERLLADAPDLHEKLTEPPERLEYGYQVLPEIEADEPVPEPRPPVKPSRYSWKRTRGFLDTEERQLRDDLEQRLARLPDLSLEERRPLYEAMVKDYKQLRSDYRLVDRHIQHNLLWQESVADNQKGYAHGTRMFAAVVERQAVLEALQAEDDKAFRKALEKLDRVDREAPREDLTPELEARERRLLGRIRAAVTPPYERAFIELTEDPPGTWVIHVPMNSDIADDEFLSAFEEAVESHWRATAGDTSYRVDITLFKLTTAELYAEECPAEADASDTSCPPEPGESIDIKRHSRLFPSERAAVTTGDTSTVVRGAACITLGPEASSKRRLAHEFGHVLGFKDDYFRGFGDLADDGFEILEISPDHADIMSSPGYGAVLPYHFEALLRVLRSRDGTSADQGPPASH